MSVVDKFVILDDVQYTRGHFNRTKILEDGKPRWLTVPVRSARIPLISIEVKDRQWIKKHAERIRQVYARSVHVAFLRRFVSEIFEERIGTWRMPMKISELDMYLIEVLQRRLSISVPVIFSSMVDYEPALKTARLINICKELGADTYVSGTGGSKEYINVDAFKKAGIRIEWQTFEYEPYEQPGAVEFVPGLSVLDTVAAFGWNGTKEYIERCGGVEEGA